MKIDKISDIHTHIVYGVDDGSSDLNMSIELLRIAYNQGTRNIICTSHDGYNIKQYFQNLKTLQRKIEKENISINLYSGSEIYCDYNIIESIITKLDSKEIPTINGTQYVLIEFSPYVTANELIYCIQQLHKHNYKVVIAHVERYCNIQSNIQCIQDLGCLLQVNAYSFKDETKKQIKDSARKLLNEKRIAFIGSDVHRTNHRPYMIKNGIDYICKTCDEEYVKDICYRNAEHLLNMK